MIEKKCAVCGKHKVKVSLFCEYCLNKKNRDQTFPSRVRAIINSHFNSNKKEVAENGKK